MTEVEQQPLAQNGIDLSAAEEYDNSKSRPADIEQDMREMERRKRVEAIMSSKLFREELERIVDSARDGGTSGIIQQLSDIVGIPMSRVGSMFRASSSLLPINDIRGVESMGYAKGEKILRCKLAATFRLLDLYGWTEGLGAQVTARLKVDQEYFLVNPYGLLYNEITASALNKVDMQGQIVEQGTTNFGINKNHFILHSVIHAARPDIRCAIYIGCNSVVAISSVKTGLLPITKDACVLGEVTTYNYTGYLYDEEERNKLVRNLGPNSKVMLLSNHGALCCGETIEEAFFAACHIVRACETQLKLLPIDVDNLILIPEETRKLIYDHARRPPEDLDKKHIISSSTEAQADVEDTAKSPTKIVGTATPKWRVGGAEFEALMRMLDNAGFRTGYIYRHPLVKSEPPKPKNDVELPPAVSSLGYLLEEEELFRQGIWKRGDLRKGGDRSRWLNSPNVYQKVEVLETGTPDPKKITKWVAEGSPTHSTPVRIEDPLQFVPVNTNPREFKRVQQQIKDNRRADKISAGPQSHILEGVTWDEANRIKDANVNSSSDHVVLVGAASKGIIQRGFQHNATVYKAPYAKNPFDCVTDDELNEYKRTVERKKKSIYGEYTDTDFSESEALSSQQTSGAQQPQIKEMTTTKTPTTAAAISQSEPEDISEPQVMRIQTQQAPVRSQPEIVLSDASPYANVSNITFNTENKSFHQHHNCHTHNCRSTIDSNSYTGVGPAANSLLRKYAFLWEFSAEQQEQQPSNILIHMIYKIELYPHYTYPTISVTNKQAQQQQEQQQHFKKQQLQRQQHDSLYLKYNRSNDCMSTITNPIKVKDVNEVTELNPVQTPSSPSSSPQPPYRTVSHYGFNYPLTYNRDVRIHPVCLLTSVELQRQKVITFIRRLNMERTSSSFQFHKTNTKMRPTQTTVVLPSPSVTLSAPPPPFFIESGKFTKEAKGSLEKSGSYVSVKDISLHKGQNNKIMSCGIENGETILSKGKQSKSVTTNRRNTLSENQSTTDNSSILSITGTQPHSIDFSGDHYGDHHGIEHHQEHFNINICSDSGDTFINYDHHHHAFYNNRIEKSLNLKSIVNDDCFIKASTTTAETTTITTNKTTSLSRGRKMQGSSDDDNNNDDNEMLDPHKPEAEQITSIKSYYQNDYDNNNTKNHHANNVDDGKHIKLTLNSLKRHGSYSVMRTNNNNDCNNGFSKASLSQVTSNTNTNTNTYATNSTTTENTIEIHINVSVQNRDCIKNLQNYEDEFKEKLQKLVDNEINLITQQLAEQQQQLQEEGNEVKMEEEMKDIDKAEVQSYHHQKLLEMENEEEQKKLVVDMERHVQVGCNLYENVSQAQQKMLITRCLSAPECINVWATNPQRHHSKSLISSSGNVNVKPPKPTLLSPPLNAKSIEVCKVEKELEEEEAEEEKETIRKGREEIEEDIGEDAENILDIAATLQSSQYRYILTMLEHELECLLNGIIQNMCDCKLRLNQISNDLRVNSLHVGPLLKKKDYQKNRL